VLREFVARQSLIVSTQVGGVITRGFRGPPATIEEAWEARARSDTVRLFWVRRPLNREVDEIVGHEDSGEFRRGADGAGLRRHATSGAATEKAIRILCDPGSAPRRNNGPSANKAVLGGMLGRRANPTSRTARRWQIVAGQVIASQKWGDLSFAGASARVSSKRS